MTTEETFWSRVDKSPGQGPHGDCWHWTGTKYAAGYGQVRIDRKNKLAHRVAYAYAHGSDVPRDVVVMHSCDNPSCVNPAHLKAGTQLDNMQDMIAKGRYKNGNVGLLTCKRGHAFSPENTRIAANGQRLCRTCLRAGSQAKKQKIRDANIANGTFRKWKAPVTHCKHGHEYTPENTYIVASGARICRTCSLERARQAESRPIRAKGPEKSPEHRAKLAAAKKAYWDNKKANSQPNSAP